MKLTIKQMETIKAKNLADIAMRIAKTGNMMIVSYDEESRNNGAKEILTLLNQEQYKTPSDVVIKKGEAPLGEYKKPVVIINDQKNLYVYQAINKEQALTIYNKHALANLVVEDLNPTKLEIVK